MKKIILKCDNNCKSTVEDFNDAVLCMKAYKAGWVRIIDKDYCEHCAWEAMKKFNEPDEKLSPGMQP